MSNVSSLVCADSCLNVKVDDLLTEKAVVCHGSGERGERGATETNNLVCTEKQKHIYGNNTHETTFWIKGTQIPYIVFSKSSF